MKLADVLLVCTPDGRQESVWDDRLGPVASLDEGAFVGRLSRVVVTRHDYQPAKPQADPPVAASYTIRVGVTIDGKELRGACASAETEAAAHLAALKSVWELICQQADQRVSEASTYTAAKTELDAESRLG